MAKISNTARSEVATAFTTLKFLRLYSGSMPTDRNADPTGTLLAEVGSITEYIQWSPDVSGGVCTIDAPTTSSVPATSGTVGYGMLYAPPISSNPINTWIYCTVGLDGSGAELILSSLDLAEGCVFTVRSGSATVPG
jgi:hypothetical protein